GSGVAAGADRALIAPPRDRTLITPSRDRTLITPARDRALVAATRDRTQVTPSRHALAGAAGLGLGDALRRPPHALRRAARLEHVEQALLGVGRAAGRRHAGWHLEHLAAPGASALLPGERHGHLRDALAVRAGELDPRRHAPSVAGRR